ncbi:MAG: NADH-quinone oxidoreductase subunit D-related protein [Thermoplasmataceae archaeon]
MKSIDVIEGFFHDEGSRFLIKRGSLLPEENNDLKLDELEQSNALAGKFIHESSGENVFRFDYGPSSGGIIETILFQMYTNGEKILSLNAFPDFKKRNILIKEENIDMALMRMERFNGFHSASYSSLFCKAVEEALAIEPNQDVKALRIIMMETERIASHLFVIERLCEAASQNIASFHLSALRERVLRAVTNAFMHRYFFGVNIIGGIARDIELGSFREEIFTVIHEFKNILELLSKSRIFIDRIQRTCLTESEWMCGPSLRAASRSYDYRKTDQYYRGIKFTPVSEKGSDSLARFLARSNEIIESGKIIDELTGSIDFVKSTKTIKKKDSGFSLSKVETPSGDCPMFIRVRNERIINAYVRAPSTMNLEAFLTGMPGNVKTDFPFAYESFGIWISELSVII